MKLLFLFLHGLLIGFPPAGKLHSSLPAQADGDPHPKWERVARADSSRVARIVEKHIRENYFEGAVLVAEKGSVYYRREAGFADHAENLRIDEGTRFRVASITKMFTAIVILQLVEEGKLGLDQSLKELLPGLAVPKAHKITVHHLLLHISGLPNERDRQYLQPSRPVKMVRAALQNKAKGRFGAFNYNNVDYMLLGLIVEKADGRSWQEAVSRRILQPLSMAETGFSERRAEPRTLARTYRVTDRGEFRPDPDFHIENLYAAGCMYSTTTDLLKLDQALYGHSLLTPESRERLSRSYPEYNYSGYSVWNYHYPFVKGKPRIMERRGGILGANGVIVRLPDMNKTIIILSNNDRFNPDSFGDENNFRECLIREVAK